MCALLLLLLLLLLLSWELLTGFMPNSHGRCVWSLTRTSLNVKVKGRKGGYRGPVGTDAALWVQKPCGYTGPQNLLMLEVLGIGLHMLIF